MLLRRAVTRLSSGKNAPAVSCRASSSLLTYERAAPSSFLQPSGTGGVAAGLALYSEEQAAGSPGQGRRWMRGGMESCVDKVTKSSRLIANYIATYKFRDPQWAPMLSLPCGNPVGFELRARHVNVSLRHLVQKGHALYLITDTEHTVFHPHGLAERSFVTVSLGRGGDRLKCLLVHEGPVDAANPSGDRDVVGLSVSHSFAMPFDRRKMVVERSRRIGTIQAGMGAMDWALLEPPMVGREKPEDVFLLHNHTQMLSGGMQSAGIVSSINVAKHAYHYVTEFEAPSTVQADIVAQMGFFVGSQHDLLDAKHGEPLHALAWSSQGSLPRGVPLEVDLPFKAQAGRPDVSESRSTYHRGGIGTPFADGAPVFRVDSHIFQGAPEYLYDPAGPSRRSGKWWRQVDSLCGEHVSYYVREGNLRKLRPFEKISNPFASSAGQRKGVFSTLRFDTSRSRWDADSGALPTQRRSGGGDDEEDDGDVEVVALERQDDLAETELAAHLKDSDTAPKVASPIDAAMEEERDQQERNQQQQEQPQQQAEPTAAASSTGPSSGPGHAPTRRDQTASRSASRRAASDRAVARLKGVRVRPRKME
jgi:hypothetical protein